MLTAEELDKESKATDKESAGKYSDAAFDWEWIGKGYRAKGMPPNAECCYLCEAARAYARASRDYSNNHLKDLREVTHGYQGRRR